MLIEFQCNHCSKALFAQGLYAGRRTTCPACQQKLNIPLIPPKFDASGTEIPAQPLELMLEAKPDDVISGEETKRCPYCSEKIMASARKCRHCGEFLDPELRGVEETKRRDITAAAYQDVHARSTKNWRALSILATSLTSGWITFLTLGYIFNRVFPTAGDTLPLAPWSLIFFNLVLMFGLFKLVRAMRAGPASVFLSAAFAIVCCMPLNVALGMPMLTIEQARNVTPQFKDYTQDDLFWFYFSGNAMIGMFFSLPVWFTALKVARQASIDAKTKKTEPNSK